MSVIGPRPLLVEYLPYYTKEEHHRHDVRPGLSGWAQINGRNAIDSWEQRFQYDLEYVKNVSFACVFLPIKNMCVESNSYLTYMNCMIISLIEIIQPLGTGISGFLSVPGVQYY